MFRSASQLPDPVAAECLAPGRVFRGRAALLSGVAFSGVVLAAGLLATGCFALRSRKEELRNQLIGVDARSLRGCVGVPTSVDVEGEREVHVYRFVETAGLTDRIAVASPGRLPRPGDVESTMGESPGFCELTFKLREGKVEEVAVKARRPSGLNDDVGCLRRAESCRVPAASSR